MARWWKEIYNSDKHKNTMYGIIDGQYQYNFDFSNSDNLRKQYVIHVEVVGFGFTFLSLRQLEICIQYFSQKIRKSSMIPSNSIGVADYWEVQRWYDRLPKGMTNEHKRPKILKALNQAYQEFKKDNKYMPVSNI
ncbi:hypothetical protein [Candidatus Albibeggiatoa sp. nov. NOAA]|uniref:hypothetical protein n=1 Tax=Candidatus Albibeggiatoa sp. nov. NOAA TaxID=3162724 RepID=UPI0032FD4044|nr:hypothetical protein [Thiotrichaceae bacterium]